jgi:hemerythrin-like domain-containing protein
MATSRNGPGSRSQPLALELLEADHRKVEALFEQYEEEKEGDEETKRGIAQRICGELTVHAQVEEEIFYPWLRENLDDESLVEEAAVEHATAKDLIAQLEGSSGIDETYDARVKVLSEYIKHHVKEEENEIFKEVRAKKEELDEIGQEMAARKAELMEEMGLEEEGAPVPQREKSRQGREQRSR